MILLAGLGKVDPYSRKSDQVSITFCLQSGPDRYTVETAGLEQYRLIENLGPGHNVLVIGTAETRKNGRCRHHVTVKARLILPADKIGPAEQQIIIALTGQIMESHFAAVKND